jgi:hypothetical protein
MSAGMDPANQGAVVDGIAPRHVAAAGYTISL